MRRELLAAFCVLLLGAVMTLSYPAHASVRAQVTEPVDAATWTRSWAHRHPYLVCLRRIESPGRRIWPYDDGYTYNTGNGYTGAYQYRNSTWATAATYAGARMLAGTPAYRVSMQRQDQVTLKYAQATGGSPWGYRCAGYLK